MKKPLKPILACVLLSLLLACPHVTRGASPPDDGKPRLVLVSIDGLRPDFYRGVSFARESPNLRALAARGVSAAGMEPIFPSLTYPVHTSIVTGVSSSRHGIPANTVFAPKTGPTPDWYWFADRIQVPTLWERARKAGRTVAIVRWPASVGAQVDWLVPEIFGSTGFDLGADWKLIQQHSRRELMDEVLADSGLSVTKGYQSLKELDRFTLHAARRILQVHQPELTLVHLVNLDFVQHLTGRASPETHAALQETDGLIGQLLASVDLRRTNVVLLGDHGFLDYDKVLAVNVLFREQGWLATDGPVLKSWKVVAHAEGGQAAIYLAPGEGIELGRQVLELLRKNAPGRYTVLDREALDRLQAYPGALCALEAEPGFALGGSLAGAFEVQLKSARGAHGHLPSRPALRAGFIAAGPAVGRTGDLGEIRVLDVAPTIASVLGLESAPAAIEFEGRALELN